MFLIYSYDQELGNKYIIDMNNRLIHVSEVLEVCFIKQNLVLGFVDQSLAFSLIEYVSFSTKGFVFGCPIVISCSLMVE
jgi:hypothetical protein